MRRIVIVVFWLTLFATPIYLSLSTYQVAEHLETRVTGNIETADLSRLWFSPGGDLVGLSEKDAELNVRVWSSGASRLVRQRTVTLPVAQDGLKPPFAISGDASKAAWIVPAGVHVEGLLSPSNESNAAIGFKRTVTISALAFTGSGQLVALYRDGELEIWDQAGERVTASRHIEIADPAILLATGQYVAAYSSATGNAFVLDTGSGDKFSLVEYMRYPPNGLSVTLSPLARFAVGTRETLEFEGHSMSAQGPVRSLAYFDRNRVLVGGDFAGIYMLDVDHGPQQVAAAAPGTSVMAAAGSNLAFGNGRLLALASNRLVRDRVYRGVSKPPTWLLIVLFGTMTAVAFYFLYGTFGFILRRLFRLQPSELHEPKPEEEDEPIPKALIEACQNGDCVLWAGSGLAAQAGLPTWTAFLRELLGWAVRGELAPAEVTTPALAELADGKAGSAADRIATAFEDREQLLQAYLRRRFRVSLELPETHRLIKEIDFPALISTNLDNLLERTFPQSGGRVYTAVKRADLRHAAAHREFFLLKPFGDLDEPQTIRLGPARCIGALRSNPAIPEFVQELFETRVFLFIGASLEGLEKDLAHLTPPAPARRKHYALVPAIGDGWISTAERLRQRYGIEPLTYSPSTASHPEVTDFLTKLVELIRQRSSTQEYFAAG